MKRFLVIVITIPLLLAFLFVVSKGFAVHKFIGRPELLLTVLTFGGWHVLFSVIFWAVLRGRRFLLFCNISNVACTMLTSVLMFFLTSYMVLKGGPMQRIM